MALDKNSLIELARANAKASLNPSMTFSFGNQKLSAEALNTTFIQELNELGNTPQKFRENQNLIYTLLEVGLTEVLPVKVAQAETHELDAVMEFEPSPHSVLQQLVPMYITNSIYQALLEANASELASRMTAMSAASNNAEEMITTLTIDYNKARQAAITQELVEIVSGAQGVQ